MSWRDGAWVNARRLAIYPRLAAAVYALVMLVLVASSFGLNDGSGRPLGTDFSSLYAAGTLARDGMPQQAYARDALYTQQQQIFGTKTPFYGWYYPPVFLLAGEALASLPYLPALGVYIGLTLGGYLLAMRRILPQREALYAALGLGAVFMNVTHGNNGFLSAALMGGGLALLPSRPVLGGLLLGAMVYKPQFALLVPLALVAGGYWRALIASGVAACALAALSYVHFGADTWAAFFDGTEFTRRIVLERGGVDFYKMQSLFAWVRYAGGNVGLAYALQAMLAMGAAVSVIWLWRGAVPYELKAAVLPVAALLATPYSFDYDLVLLAPALAFYARLGLREGFSDYEKSALAAGWAVGLPARAVAMVTNIFIAPLVLVFLMALLLRRAARLLLQQQ